MNPEIISPEPISSESEAKCESQPTKPATMDSSETTDSTVSTQPSQAAPLVDGCEQHNGQINEPQGQPPATAPATRETSERKKAANRLNSGKSTGPKTTRGKANSSRNARKHCLLAQKVLFDSKGMPQDEGYHALYLQLLEEYPGDDLITQLRREALLAAYWRNVQALRYERDLMEQHGVGAFQTYLMPILHRYSVANQNAFAARLQELEDTASLLVQPEDNAVGEEADRAADDATSMEECDNQDSSTEVTAGSTESTQIDSAADSSASIDSTLPSLAAEEVAPTAEPENENLDQSATALPPPDNAVVVPDVSQIWDEAESENQSGAAQPPVIQ
jgi:hypothetical protein